MSQDKGKNRRRQLIVKDSIHNKILSVDSQEEIDTLNFLEECKELSIINDFSYQPEPFVLSNPVKYQDIHDRTRTLFQEHIYTADWVVEFTPSAYQELSKEFKVPYSCLSCKNYKVYIDSKGTFNRTERSFGYNQKWLFQRFKIYVYKLVPKNFFKKFGVPLRSMFTNKTKKPRTQFRGFKTIKEMFSIK